MPTTAPSVDVNSTSALGRTRHASSESVPTHSSESACATATRSPGPSVVASAKRRSISAMRLLLAAYAGDGDDLPVLHAQYRPQVEERPGDRLRLPDATAALEVLERLHREEHVAVRVEALDQRRDLLIRGSAREPALDGVGEHRDRERCRLGVDDAHLVAADVLRRELRARKGPRDLGGHVERVDPLVCGERLVDLDEVRRRRLGGGGRDG